MSLDLHQLLGRTAVIHEGPRQIEARLVLDLERVKRKVLVGRFGSLDGWGLPLDASHTRYDVKMSVPAQKREIVLAAKSRNPNIVRWDWFTDCLSSKMIAA